METLFDTFLQEKRYLVGISKHTERAYRFALERLKTFELKRASLNSFVLSLRESGLSPSGCNVYIRSANSFLTWCFENNYTPEHPRIKQLRTTQPVIKIFFGNGY